MLALAFFMVAHLLCFHPMVEFRTLINNHYTSGHCIYFIFSFWHPSDLFVIYYCYTYTENFLNYFLVSNVIYLEVVIFYSTRILCLFHHSFWYAYIDSYKTARINLLAHNSTYFLFYCMHLWEIVSQVGAPTFVFSIEVLE